MRSSVKNEAFFNLAKRIKALRKERNLTQEIAYNDTGIHFARIEQGNRDISYTTLLKICKYFEISPEEFFKGMK